LLQSTHEMCDFNLNDLWTREVISALRAGIHKQK
jgi:hypothetical protein